MKDNEILTMFMQADLVTLPDIHAKAPWCENDGELVYNTEENEEDLIDGNGETYGGTIKSKDILGDYVIFEVDSGCGWDYQVILAVANEVEGGD